MRGNFYKLLVTQQNMLDFFISSVAGLYVFSRVTLMHKPRTQESKEL